MLYSCVVSHSFGSENPIIGLMEFLETLWFTKTCDIYSEGSLYYG